MPYLCVTETGIGAHDTLDDVLEYIESRTGLSLLMTIPPRILLDNAGDDITYTQTSLFHEENYWSIVDDTHGTFMIAEVDSVAPWYFLTVHPSHDDYREDYRQTTIDIDPCMDPIALMKEMITLDFDELVDETRAYPSGLIECVRWHLEGVKAAIDSGDPTRLDVCDDSMTTYSWVRP